MVASPRAELGEDVLVGRVEARNKEMACCLERGAQFRAMSKYTTTLKDHDKG